MSNKNVNDSGKRAYTLKERARRREEVHRRITEAAVYFHGTVGPARTTMGDIAKRAGVRRATVYNHFPNERELIDACSSHWFSDNPPPDPAVWKQISDPTRRVETGLKEMYDYYEHGQNMLENVLRDTELVPALKEILRLKWWPLMDMMVGILSKADPEKNLDESSDLTAIVRVALDFFTWQTLNRSGLSNVRAAELATGWVRNTLKGSGK